MGPHINVTLQGGTLDYMPGYINAGSSFTLKVPDSQCLRLFTKRTTNVVNLIWQVVP